MTYLGVIAGGWLHFHYGERLKSKAFRFHKYLVYSVQIKTTLIGTIKEILFFLSSLFVANPTKHTDTYRLIKKSIVSFCI